MAKPVNTGLSCHAPSPILYSPLAIASRVMLVVVALAFAGRAGASWSALAMEKSAVASPPL